jgi:hypothetical protein
MTNELWRHGWDESYREYARKMDLFENGPETTNFQQLLDKGIALPEPSSIPDVEMRTKLWEVLAGLADLRVHLDHTDHLSDRELYEKLWRDTLRIDVPAIDEIGFSSYVQLLMPDGTEPETSIFFRYFADDDWRRDRMKDEPQYTMPPHEDPPYNRDALLPQPNHDSWPEASNWLRANWHASALASNRFGPTTEAIAFVEQLYDAGATGVAVDNIMMLPNHDWTPYADTLIVELPEEHEQRRALLALMRDVGRPDEDGEESIENLFTDSGQSRVRLWWD